MTAVAEDAGPTLTTLRGQEARDTLETWVSGLSSAPDPMYVRQLVDYVKELEDELKWLRGIR